MKKNTKLFKIGESCYYGKWRLTLVVNRVTVTGIDYFTNDVMDEKDFYLPDDELALQNYLEEVSTIGWADEMIKWVKKVYPNLRYL